MASFVLSTCVDVALGAKPHACFHHENRSSVGIKQGIDFVFAQFSMVTLHVLSSICMFLATELANTALSDTNSNELLLGKLFESLLDYVTVPTTLTDRPLR
jgi:hypothetical protein